MKAIATRVAAVWPAVFVVGSALAKAQEAAPAAAPEGAVGMELSPWSAILVIVTLVIVFGGIVVYLAVERRRA